MDWIKAAQTRWATLARRERRALMLALLLVGGATLWWVLLAPALRTLREAPQARLQLDAAWDQMQQMQARARALQGQSAVPADAVLTQLRDVTKALGAGATLQIQADQVTLTLRQVNAARLAEWLGGDIAQRVRPVEVHITRDVTASAPVWFGRLLFRLPGALPQSR